MIDPLISLALTLMSRPGVFALLLGSGLSRSAGIPTGWEVVLDLVKRVALLEDVDPGPDPAQWWHARTGKDPSYSDLLEALGHTPAERTNLLRGYFEPNDDERLQGLKTPTKAHHAIAHLVRDGLHPGCHHHQLRPSTRAGARSRGHRPGGDQQPGRRCGGTAACPR